MLLLLLLLRSFVCAAMITMQLSILTLNIWGIPYMSPHRNIRISAIADELASGKYDIVSLQEVWTEHDSQLIQMKTKNVLPYAHYFYSGVMGAGLLVLSKYPIVSSLFHAWPINGYFHRIQHADWFGGKGLGLCRIRIDPATYIHFYNAHLHAEYSVKYNDYKTHRVLQAFDAAQFIEATRNDAILQVLAGDLNARPGDVSYKTLLYISGMHETCPLNNVETCENRYNYYKQNQLEEGMHLDHIWLRASSLSSSSPSSESVLKSNIRIKVLNYTLPLPNRIPKQLISYSDHEAVLVKLQLDKQDGKETEQTNRTITIGTNEEKSFGESQNTNRQQKIDLLKETISLCDGHLKQLKMDRIVYYTAAFVLVTTYFLIPQYNCKIFQVLLHLLVIASVIFCLFMGLFWNFMERHATMSGRNSMTMKLNGLILND